MSPSIRASHDKGTMKLRENPSPLINYNRDDLHEFAEEDNTSRDGYRNDTQAI